MNMTNLLNVLDEYDQNTIISTKTHKNGIRFVLCSRIV